MTYDRGVARLLVSGQLYPRVRVIITRIQCRSMAMQTHADS